MSFESFPQPVSQEQNPATEMLLQNVENLITNAEDTDVIYGTIKGRIKTVPTTYFEESFDATKADINTVLEAIMAKIPADAEMETLNRELFIADAGEKEKAIDERIVKNGGYGVII
ncbi:MAG: hypothetical protein WCQ32_01170 [bacterium]